MAQRSRNHTRRPKEDKIQEALELLNEAAREKKSEFYDLLGQKYSDLKTAVMDTFMEAAEDGREVLDQAAKTASHRLQDAEKKFKRTATVVEKKVKDNSWPLVLGAVVGFVLRDMMRRR